MNLNELSRKLDELAEHSLTPTYFSSSFEKLLELFAAILELKGEPGWYEEVNKRLGSDFTEEDALSLQPLVSVLTGTVQKGGLISSKPPPNQVDKEAIVMQTNPISRFKSSPSKTSDTQIVSTSADSSKPVYYESFILDMFKTLATKMRELGPFNYEVTDKQNSDYPVGNTTVNAIQSIPIPPLKLALTGAETAEKTAVTASPVDLPFYLTPFKTARSIVLPHRAATTLAQTLISLLRFASAASPIDVPFWRQILSVTSTIMYMFKGDWQSALLSLVGIYSQNAAYAGIIANVVMDIFSLMDVRYQENIRDGLLDVPKSLLVGLLLTTFQTFATFDMRKKTSAILDKILENELRLTQNIKGTGDLLANKILEAKQGGLDNLNFNTLNLLQTIIHRKVETCSTNFQAIIKPHYIQDNPILRILFIIMNIPVTAEEIASVCGKEVSWADGIIEAVKEEEGLGNTKGAPQPQLLGNAARDPTTNKVITNANGIPQAPGMIASQAATAATPVAEITPAPTTPITTPAASTPPAAETTPPASAPTPAASTPPVADTTTPAPAPAPAPSVAETASAAPTPPVAETPPPASTTPAPTPPQSATEKPQSPTANRSPVPVTGGGLRRKRITSSSPQSRSLLSRE
jgi:hypothetical protein